MDRTELASLAGCLLPLPLLVLPRLPGGRLVHSHASSQPGWHMSCFVLATAVCGEELLLMQRSPHPKHVHRAGASEVSTWLCSCPRLVHSPSCARIGVPLPATLRRPVLPPRPCSGARMMFPSLALLPLSFFFCCRGGCAPAPARPPRCAAPPEPCLAVVRSSACSFALHSIAVPRQRCGHAPPRRASRSRCLELPGQRRCAPRSPCEGSRWRTRGGVNSLF